MKLYLLNFTIKVLFLKKLCRFMKTTVVYNRTGILVLKNCHSLLQLILKNI